jgi:serine/threonine protein phosphatase PrpC
MSSPRPVPRWTAVNHRILNAGGLSDPGRQREVNEDRLYLDATRGIFVVIDGVGGHAAGGKAADVALALLRERLERETGPVADRVREAITIANNEIFRLAATRPEWDGMACVLTVAIVEEGRATIGHVGDTRLYKAHRGTLEKITRDHSPVGEREDAQEISEEEAMRHPRRNEVYRDVGSEPHELGDEEFVEVQEIAFEPEAALLLCSDGLTDLIDSATIARAIHRLAGAPQAVVEALVDAANEAGGKDNVTVVYVEGEQFAESRSLVAAEDERADVTEPQEEPAEGARSKIGKWARLALLALLLIVVGLALLRMFDVSLGRTIDRALGRAFDLVWSLPSLIIPSASGLEVQIVKPTESIRAAIDRAEPGSQVLVEPGEYREQVFLRSGVRVVSRVPGAASIRLPIDAPEGAAVIANGLSGAEFAGFRIVGDAATPLGVGIFVDDSALSIVDVEISGATRAGIEFAGGRAATLLASTIHDNPGAALVIHRGASPRIAHNTFRGNDGSERATGVLSVDAGAAPVFRKNVFVGFGADASTTLEQTTRLPLSSDNWFVADRDVGRPRATPPSPSGTSRKR